MDPGFATPERSGFRLLVVDDDLGTIRQLGRMLSGFAQVSFATSGEDALAMARTQQPDLILLDAEMPGLSGFEVLAALRADAVTADVPVVFATNHHEPAIEAAALRQGAADFIAKPLLPSQVLARVRCQLQQRSPSAARAHSPVPCILIADDGATNRELFTGLLAGIGNCHFARDSRHAVKLAATLQPDLLLLDLDVPLIDGLGLCRRLKESPEGSWLAVAAITQRASAEDEAKAFEHGVDDFIGKPFDREVLLARVRRLIDRKRRITADLDAVRAHWQGLGEARVAEIVAAASDAIVVANAGGRIAMANRAAAAMFGQLAESLVGLSLVQFLPASTEAGPAAGRQPLLRADGSSISVDLAVSEIGAGRDRLLTCVLRDTTVRDRVEAHARQCAATEAAQKATAAMLGFIAHEMGNSLNALLGFAQLARSDETTPLPPVQAQRLDHITRAARQLQSLMRDVMDLNRLEAGKFSLESSVFDPVKVVSEACLEVASQADRAGTLLRQQPLPQVARMSGDARRLQQCLVNLLSNAIKYGAQGGPVDIGIEERGSELVIEVRDQGAGLSQQQLQHLFEPYNRLGREASRIPGTGLGLVLTRELAMAMGGRMEVESAVGAGCCFRLCFPGSPPRPDADPAA